MVRVDGQQVGVTPLRYSVTRRSDLLVEVRKESYKSEFRRTTRKLSSLGSVDALFGGFIILPLLGLLLPGAWEHDPSVIGFSLEPEAVSPTPTPTPQK
jgi:hypothetical protein